MNNNLMDIYRVVKKKFNTFIGFELQKSDTFLVSDIFLRLALKNLLVSKVFSRESQKILVSDDFLRESRKKIFSIGCLFHAKRETFFRI